MHVALTYVLNFELAPFFFSWSLSGTMFVALRHVSNLCKQNIGSFNPGDAERMTVCVCREAAAGIVDAIIAAPKEADLRLKMPELWSRRA